MGTSAIVSLLVKEQQKETINRPIIPKTLLILFKIFKFKLLNRMLGGNLLVC
jgi:hypothetical protein